MAASVAGLDNHVLPTNWTITVVLCASVLLPVMVLLFTPRSPAGLWLIALLMVVHRLDATVLIAGAATRPIALLRYSRHVRLGDWSYSLYLLHLQIAYILARTLRYVGLAGNHDAAAVAVAVLTTAVIVPLSTLTYRWIELPGIAMGSRLLVQLLGWDWLARVGKRA